MFYDVQMMERVKPFKAHYTPMHSIWMNAEPNTEEPTHSGFERRLGK